MASGSRATLPRRHWRSTRNMRRPMHAGGWISQYYDLDLAEAARYLEHALELEPDNANILLEASSC